MPEGRPRPVALGDRLLLTGMGSSWFAAETVARRLRRAGVNAVAELASVEASFPADKSLVVIGCFASMHQVKHPPLTVIEQAFAECLECLVTPAEHRGCRRGVVEWIVALS